MNVTKRDVLLALSKHAGKWRKSRTIAKEVGLNTTEGINRISQILCRLRSDTHIERRKHSHDYSYRYIDEIGGHPPNIHPLSKIEDEKKAVGGRGGDIFTGFSFIELIDVTEDFCELCGVKKKIFYKAERNNRWVFVCKQCGDRIKKKSAVFEWGEFNA